MKTYQDLLAVGEDEQNRMAFVLAVINDHKASTAYTVAVDALDYYERLNPTINRYEKVIYDLQGKVHKDEYTANHKISSSFFQLVVDQQVSYLLGNGVTFANDKTKDKLGVNFDGDMVKLATFAQWGGQAWGFWNLDHIEPFSILEFAPLLDEETGALMAGVRFWQLDDKKPLRATLFEMDGYTDYIKGKDGMAVLNKKRPYKVNVSTSATGTEITEGESYPGFPVVPLRMGRRGLSEIVGRQNLIDALDLIDSGLINNIDEANLVYWVIKGAGAMDNTDLGEFIDRIKINHAFVLGDGQEADPHTIDVPVAATQTAHDILTKKLYEDFQAFDSSAVSAGQQTATAIKACYVPLDLKTDKFEYEVTNFILGILALAGIDDKPSYTRNKIINGQEEMQTLMLAAPYCDEEYLTQKALTIMGDADQYEDMMKRKAAEDIDRVSAEPEEGKEDDGMGIGEGQTA